MRAASRSRLFRASLPEGQKLSKLRTFEFPYIFYCFFLPLWPAQSLISQPTAFARMASYMYLDIHTYIVKHTHTHIFIFLFLFVFIFIFIFILIFIYIDPESRDKEKEK